MPRAALYARVSTANQENEETIENQLFEIKEHIKQDGNLLLPDCIYKDDGWTGTMLERPELDRMRSDARQQVFDILYFYDRGRIARKFVYQEIVLEELRDAGIECVSLHDVNGDSDEERLLGGVMGIFAEYERVKITERMRLGKMRKVREGRLLGYNPPYGYNYHPRIKKGAEARDGYFTINQKEAEVVVMIFEWVADGVSLREVIRRLHEAGIPPRKQKRATWTKGPVVRLLQNTTYIGKHYYNKSEAAVCKNPRNPEQKYRRIKKTTRVARPKEEWLLVEVPRIVNDELFAKAQQQLELNLKFSRRNNVSNRYLLTGVVECECGKPRTGDPGNNGHLYYRCTDRLTRFPLERQCHAGGVNARLLDALVWDKLRMMLVNPQLAEKQAERWLGGRSYSPEKARLDELGKRLRKLDQEERRYVRAYGLGYLSERLYKDQMQGVASQRETIENEIRRITAEADKQPQLTREELVAGLHELLRSLDFTDKKFIIRKIATRVKATQEEAIIWGQLPILVAEQVGLHVEHRYRRPAQRR